MQFGTAEETAVLGASVRKFTMTNGEKTISQVVFEAPLTPELASALGSWPLLYNGDDNTPRQGYRKLKLDIDRVKNARLRSADDWAATPFEANPLSVTGFEVKRRDGRLLLSFTARFDSYAIAVFDFVNEAGEGAFTLRVGPAAPAEPVVDENAPAAPEPTDDQVRLAFDAAVAEPPAGKPPEPTAEEIEAALAAIGGDPPDFGPPPEGWPPADPPYPPHPPADDPPPGGYPADRQPPPEETGGEAVL